MNAVKLAHGGNGSATHLLKSNVTFITLLLKKKTIIGVVGGLVSDEQNSLQFFLTVI